MTFQPSSASDAEPRSSAASSASSVAVAMTIMNLATYAFTMLAARQTGPSEYGAFVAALNFLTVIQVISLGLQTTAARRVSARPDDLDLADRVLRVTLWVALGLGALLLACAPLVNELLALESLPIAIVIALAAVPLTITGGQLGVLQGERRWGALALAYLMAGIPRMLVGTALILLQPSTMSAVLGVAIGYLFPVFAGWIALRRRGVSLFGTPTAGTSQRSWRSFLKESAHNSQALFAYFALSSGDILIARQVLDGHDSGLYAAGLIVAKTMLFLPQFVVVVAFPSMATPESRKRALTLSLSLVAVLGVVGTTAVWLLSDIALIFVGGTEFVDIEDTLWLFALLGTVLSLVQLLVYSVLARRGRRTVMAVWLALLAMVVCGLQAHDLTGLVRTVVLVDAGLFLVLLASTVLVRPKPHPVANV